MKWKALKRNGYFLILDIGTEAVKALIFSASGRKKGSDNRITVLGTGLQYFGECDVFDAKDFESEMIKEAISGAIESAHQDLILSLAKKEIKESVQKQKRWQVLLGLPASILKGRVVDEIIFRKNPDKKISEKGEKEILSNLFKAVRKKVSQEFNGESGILPKDIHWVSSKVLKIGIDGYSVPSIKNYGGRRLEFKVLTTFLPERYWRNIEKIVRSLNLDVLKIVHLAEVLPNFCQSKRKSGIFLDIGGEATQIIKISGDELEKVDEFKGGGKMFTQSLSQTLGMSEERARIMEKKYSKKLLSDEVVKRIGEIFFWEGKSWYDSFRSKMKRLGLGEISHSTFFLFGGGSSSLEIERILREKTDNGLKIEFICSKDLEGIESATKKINDFQSVSPLLICYSYYD